MTDDNDDFSNEVEPGLDDDDNDDDNEEEDNTNESGGGDVDDTAPNLEDMFDDGNVLTTAASC